MKRPLLLAAAAALVLLGCATPVKDSDVSLLKGSVFDTPQPVPVRYDGPGSGKPIAPLAGSGMPPMITHPVSAYLPITAQANACLGCHAAGGTRGAGAPTPLPASHVRQVGGRAEPSGAQYNCMACHAPQAATADLVPNRSPGAPR